MRCLMRVGPNCRTVADTQRSSMRLRLRGPKDELTVFSVGRKRRSRRQLRFRARLDGLQRRDSCKMGPLC